MSLSQPQTYRHHIFKADTSPKWTLSGPNQFGVHLREVLILLTYKIPAVSYFLYVWQEWSNAINILIPLTVLRVIHELRIQNNKQWYHDLPNNGLLNVYIACSYNHSLLMLYVPMICMVD